MVGRREGVERPPVRCREHEDAVVPAELVETVEEGARIVEMLDHLARDDDLRRREAEGANLHGVAAVGNERLVAVGARPGHARGVDVDTDEARSAPSQVRVQPRVVVLLHVVAAGVHESDMDRGFAGDELGQPRDAVDEWRGRQAMQHVELRPRRALGLLFGRHRAPVIGRGTAT